MAPEELKVHHIGGKEEVGNCLITFFYSHTGNRKRDEAGSTVRSLTPPKSPPLMCFLQHISTSECLITSPHSMINWRSIIQILQPVEHASNPTHHVLFAVEEMLKHCKFDFCILSWSLSFPPQTKITRKPFLDAGTMFVGLPTSRNKNQINYCSS